MLDIVLHSFRAFLLAGRHKEVDASRALKAKPLKHFRDFLTDQRHNPFHNWSPIRSSRSAATSAISFFMRF